MLKVNGLTLNYVAQKQPAIRDLSFLCPTLGVVAIVGRSGVGKSTLISCIAGIQGDERSTLEHYAGEVTIDGRSPHQIRGPQEVSWVPQTATLLEHLTVLENVLLPLTILSQYAGADRDRAATILGAVGLERALESRPRELSGGMKTRVSVARALVSEPRYLFLDEPFSALDLTNRWVLYRLILRLRRKEGLTTFFTTHNIPEAALISDQIVVVRNETNQTLVEVIPNSPALLGADEPALCLGIARSRAARIEQDVFL